MKIAAASLVLCILVYLNGRNAAEGREMSEMFNYACGNLTTVRAWNGREILIGLEQGGYKTGPQAEPPSGPHSREERKQQ